jgi:predicted Zn finger-like uncharacterized protein
MFKVVDEQLKAAQGWVRCGQCGDVFDASLHLVPVEAGGPGVLADASGPAPVQEALTEPVHVEPVWQPLTQDAQATPINPQPEPQGRQDPVFTANAYGSSLNEAEPAQVPAQAPEIPPSPAEEPEAAPEVAFVCEARQNGFWTSPLVRALLGLMGLALLAALMLQWVVRQKDVLAAHEPRLAPMLQALCRPLGCEVRPLRRIESLLIENASFRKTGADAYRLNFVFRNTGDAALEIPALEVTLIDSQDEVLVRRVVMPAQFGATAVTLAAHADLAGALFLKVSSGGAQGASAPAQAGFLPVAGYRILAFYP